MALQTFTAGQVLTAAQVNALQANDYNQTVSTKTDSYTLVAADKGTRVEMNKATATTITVNTDLFNAGDTLFIQNRGAGVCTITAGTATVSTAGSLALIQNAGGTLYFISAGVAVFYASGVAAVGSVLHVRDEKPNNTAGGTASTGDNVRVLNTVVTNTITGASLASNQITLPAGTYTISASAPGNYPGQHRARLVNVTDSVVLLLGTNAFTNSGTDYAQTNSLINGTFTLAASKALNITQYFTTGGSGKLGAQINDTFVAVFTNVFITKIG
jgi:hypothetical protein